MQQGLDSFGVNVVFNAIIMSKFVYACRAFSGFLCASDFSRCQASVSKAYRYSLNMISNIFLKSVIVIYLSKFCCILVIVCVIYSLLSVEITVGLDYCELGAISILYQLLGLNLLFTNHILLIDVCLLLS
jgi:hypothetical protein